MSNHEYTKSPEPIKLTKEKPKGPDIPRDDFKVTVPVVDGSYIVYPDCMRYVEKDGVSYAITYWNCSRVLHSNEPGTVIYECSKAELVTWVDIQV